MRARSAPPFKRGTVDGSFTAPTLPKGRNAAHVRCGYLRRSHTFVYETGFPSAQALAKRIPGRVQAWKKDRRCLQKLPRDCRLHLAIAAQGPVQVDSPRRAWAPAEERPQNVKRPRSAGQEHWSEPAPAHTAPAADCHARSRHFVAMRRNELMRQRWRMSC